TIQVKELINEKSRWKTVSQWTEKMIPKILFLITAVSIFTTIGIIFTLFSETVEFFKRVPIIEFFTGTVLKPLSQQPEFGVLPLINGTIFSSIIAMLVAGPIGIMTAVFLSEYATEKVRRVCKPVLEVLAGIPTIVYG